MSKASTQVYWSYWVSDRAQTLTVVRREWYVKSGRMKAGSEQTFPLDAVREALWKEETSDE